MVSVLLRAVSVLLRAVTVSVLLRAVSVLLRAVTVSVPLRAVSVLLRAVAVSVLLRAVSVLTGLLLCQPAGGYRPELDSEALPITADSDLGLARVSPNPVDFKWHPERRGRRAGPNPSRTQVARYRPGRSMSSGPASFSLLDSEAGRPSQVRVTVRTVTETGGAP
jgi:hypothetical protein